jgi:hypothetical protein
MHGAGLRQRQACAQSEPLRRRVDPNQKVEIAALAEDDEGRRDIIPLSRDAVG